MTFQLITSAMKGHQKTLCCCSHNSYQAGLHIQTLLQAMSPGKLSLAQVDPPAPQQSFTRKVRAAPLHRIMLSFDSTVYIYIYIDALHQNHQNTPCVFPFAQLDMAKHVKQAFLLRKSGSTASPQLGCCHLRPYFRSFLIRLEGNRRLQSLPQSSHPEIFTGHLAFPPPLPLARHLPHQLLDKIQLCQSRFNLPQSLLLWPGALPQCWQQHRPLGQHVCDKADST